jgi:hypothetical protein
MPAGSSGPSSEARNSSTSSRNFSRNRVRYSSVLCWTCRQFVVSLARADRRLSQVTPISVRLDDLDIICAVLGCEPGELLVRDPAAGKAAPQAPAATAAGSDIRPVRRGGQPRLVPALLCPRPAPGAALRGLRPDPEAPGRGTVRPLLPAVADPSGRLPRLRRTATGLVRRPVRTLQEARGGQGRDLPRLRQAGHAAVVGPLPQLRRQDPPGDRRLPRPRGPDQPRERALQGMPAVPLEPPDWHLPLVRPAAAGRRQRGVPVLPARLPGRPQAGPPVRTAPSRATCASSRHRWPPGLRGMTRCGRSPPRT